MAEGLEHPGRSLLLALALLAGLGGAVALRLEPPAPLPADAPEGAFSAERALALHRAVDPDGAPRPVGSAAHERARHAIVAELGRLGLSPEVQETFACGIYGSCALVRNVLARVGGDGPGVLLMAHYDTVSAGPGAADDGAGVAAALEIGRALVREPPLRPVILLFDDGEEGGLVGAAAFLGEHRWASEVAAAVNLEARGTGGPSLLFETTGGSAFPAALARSIPRPVTSSLFAGIYERLPNDTDLSLFRRRRVPGVNFAFIGEAERYHTARDDRAHLDPGSLQHEGESALAMVRAFAASDFERPPRGDAVFFDVIGLGIAAWPAAASVPLAAIALLLSLGAASLAARRRRIAWRAIALGLAAFAAGPLLGAAAALGLRLALAAAGALPRPWVAHPGPALAAFWCAGLAGAAGAAASARRAGPEALGAAVAIGFSALALATAAAWPAASYLFAVPALAAGAAALAAGEVPSLADPAAALAALAAAAVLLPVVLLVHLALGVLGAPAFAALLALAAAPLAPLLAALGDRARPAAWVPLGAALAAAAVAAVLPHASAARPQAMNLAFHQDADAGAARWLLAAEDERLPGPLRRAAPFSEKARQPFGWATRAAFAAPAPALAIPGPELQVLETSRRGTLRTVRARLRSPRGARDARLFFSPGSPVVAVEIEGRPARADEKLRGLIGGHGLARCLGLPPQGVEIVLSIDAEAPVQVDVADLSPGLPPGGEALLAARPPSGVPFQDGDVTLLTRRVKL